MSSGFYLASGFIYLNMSAEIMFVLANRMNAQKVDMNSVGSKILCDISLLMYKPSFIENIVKGQHPLSIPSFYQIFNKIVNSSFMKLDKNSMQKLFYLILMTFKKQMFLLSSPLQLYALTVTHLEDVYNLQKQNNQVQSCIELAIKTFKNSAQSYGFVKYVEIKEQILSMLETYKSKIVLFCQMGTQDQHGNMIHQPRNSHNRITVGQAQNHSHLAIPISHAWKNANNIAYANFKNWRTSLGKDDYDNQKGSSKTVVAQNRNYQSVDNTEDLSSLLGIKKMNLDNFDLQLDIFEGMGTGKVEQKKTKAEAKSSVKVVQIVGSEEIKKKIQKQFGELTIEGEQEDEIDLLDLMDS